MRHANLTVDTLTVKKLHVWEDANVWGEIQAGRLQSSGRKVMECIVKKIGFAVQANTIGTLPAGAVIRKVEVGIRTGFNGTSATIDIGKTGTANAYMANTAITEATPGTYTAIPDVAALAADTAVLATVGGTVGTTGDATIIFYYTTS
ncbi:MAG: hypothetical protein RBT11_14160 [Desulfobacterales bacterium]|jgi:hypothetical protein|nr:hypothetical protein [Desulfobacterales bacterium]